MKLKYYTIFILILLFISSLPLMNLSRYAHPSADDYTLSAETKKEWDENKSIMGLIKKAHDVNREWCTKWEGTYISYYLWTLQPGIFGERYYKLTGYINLAVLGFATITFFAIFVKKVLGGQYRQGIALGSVALIMMFQWMPSAVEGLYWFCGSVGYNFFWALLMMILSGLMVYRGKRDKWDIMNLFLMIVGGFLLAGGNHVTSFAGILLFSLFSIVSMTSALKRFRASIPVLISTIIGFCINVMSPGTAVRSGFFPDKSGVFETIWLALQNGMMLIEEWLTLPLLLMLILVIPIIINLCNQFQINHNFKFSCPLLIFLVSVGYFCALLCPTLFVMRNTGAGRVHNILYFTFIILVLLNTVYFTGYVLCKLGEHNIILDYKEKIEKKYLLLAGVFFIGVIIQPIQTSNSYLAMKTIQTGEAEQYSEEAQRRHELALESKGKDLELMDYTVKPEMLYFDDIKNDSLAGNNIAYADYYELKSVILKYWE